MIPSGFAYTSLETSWQMISHFTKIYGKTAHKPLVRINTLYKQDEGFSPIELSC